MDGVIAQERLNLLMELAGRCLLRYQRIEGALKLLLPHIVKPGVEASAAPNWREFVDGKYTLGPLMERLKQGLNSENLESAQAHLQRIVDERNDLVHHFFSGTRRVLTSPEGVESGITELQRRLDLSGPLDHALMSMVREFGEVLQASVEQEHQNGSAAAP